MESTPGEGSVAREATLGAPSRLSLSALLSPSATPRADEVNGAHKKDNDMLAQDDTIDVSMVEADEAEPSHGTAPATTEGAQDLNKEGEEAGDEDDEDDDDEDDGDEDDDDDDDETEEDRSASDSGEFQSVSDMDGVEGEQSKESRPEGQEEDKGEGSSAAAAAISANGTNGSTAGAGQKSPILKRTEAPKKRRPKRRSPSVDLALPVGPPARPTIRMKLTIAHDDEEAYLTNVPEHVYEILKDKKHPWADWYAATLPDPHDIDIVREVAPSSNSGPDLSELGGLAKLLLKYPDNASGKKKKVIDYDIGQYDVRDPFVDDSELGVDEPTHSAKPSSDGFFVTQGEVELQKAIAAAKDMKATLQSYQATTGKRLPIPPGFGQSVDGGGGAGALSMQMGLKPDNVTLVNSLLAERSVELGLISPAPDGDESRQSYFEPSTPVKPAAAKIEGTAQSPIRVDDDDDGQPSAAPSVAPIAKYPTRPVPRRLERELDMLRQKVAKESWLKKSKFPPSLREPLLQASKVAVALNEYNDNYFNWLPHIFPYNRLTLHKYVKRHFMDDHAEMMKELQEINLKVLGAQIEQALPILREEYEELKSKWVGTEGAVNGASNGAYNGASLEQEQTVMDDQALGAGTGEGEGDGEDGDKAEEEATNKSGEPVKRWRWSEAMREVMFTIVTINDAVQEIKAEKINLENSAEKASLTIARKLIYKRIYELFPEPEWTTTTNISREYALYRRKVDKYTLQHFETQGRDINSAILV